MQVQHELQQQSSPPTRTASSPSLSTPYNNASGLTGFALTASQHATDPEHLGRRANSVISSPARASPLPAASLAAAVGEGLSSSSSAALDSSLPPPVGTNLSALGAGARKNSAGDLAAEVSTPLTASTISEARLLYRNWRTGSHVGADLNNVQDQIPAAPAHSISEMNEVYVTKTRSSSSLLSCCVCDYIAGDI